MSLTSSLPKTECIQGEYLTEMLKWQSHVERSELKMTVGLSLKPRYKYVIFF